MNEVEVAGAASPNVSCPLSIACSVAVSSLNLTAMTNTYIRPAAGGELALHSLENRVNKQVDWEVCL